MDNEINKDNTMQEAAVNDSMVKDSNINLDDIILAEEVAIQPRGLKYFFKCMTKSKSGFFGFLVIIFLILCAVFADSLAPNDPNLIDLSKMLLPPFWAEGGDPGYLLGTDAMGRCILSRIIHGTQVSLLVGFAAVFLAGLVGTVLGLLAGYFGGFVDSVIMRVAEIFQAFPFVLLAVAMMVVLGSGIFNLILAISISGWVQYARLIRGEVIALRQKEYVEATKVVGLPRWRTVFIHILPNVISSVIVIASFSLASSILTEAALSFLGLGVSPTIPSWGAMISYSKEYIYVAWWTAVFPGLALVLTVLGVNLFGDWLRDYLDPRIVNY